MRWLSPPRVRHCVVASFLLTCLGCSEDEVDYCTESGHAADPPVGCDGHGVSVLATASNSSERYNAQVARTRQDVVIDGEFVYWADVNGRVLKVPKRGGRSEELVPASACSVSDLAVDEAFVYFGQNCRIEGDASDFPVEGRVVRIDKLTHEPTELEAFYNAEVARVQAYRGQLYAGVGRVTSAELVVVASGSAPLVQVNTSYVPFEVADGVLYYANNRAFEVRKLVLETLEDELVSRSIRAVSSLHVLDDEVFWLVPDSTGFTNSSLFRPAPGSERGELAVEGPCPSLMGLDAEGFYGAGHAEPSSSTAYRVYRWLSVDAPREILAAGLHGPEGVAADDTHVYVTDLAWAQDPMRLRVLRVER